MLLPYEDLLGTPWELDGEVPGKGMDCAGVAAEIWKRLGLLDDPDIFRARTRFLDDKLRIEHYFEEMGQHFRRLGSGYRCANRAGDIILSAPEDPQLITHIAVVVDPVKSIALSSAYSIGVHAAKTWAIRNISGVYRKVSLYV